jgi:hypothetical protein
LLKTVDLGKLAAETQADKWNKKFNASSHLKTMTLSQIAGCASLREIENAIEPFQGELMHAGITCNPNRSTISHANAVRNWQFFEKAFYSTLSAAHKYCDRQAGRKRKGFTFDRKLFSIDSTTIDLCQKLYDWAKYRTTKGGVKVHVMLDNHLHLPVWAHITDAKDHDQKVLETIDPVKGLPKGSFVVADRAYNDYAMLSLWNERGINFVLRAKDNMAYEVVKDLDVPKKTGRPSTKADDEKPRESHVVKDQIIRFTGKKAEADYPGTLRMVTFWVEEEPGSKRQSREMRLIANNLSLSPKTIAECYKSRWEIEAFFKTIKQHLKLKAFLGTSANAVKIQVYCALITIVLLRFLAAMSKRGWCVSHLLAIIRLSLYLHRDLMYFLDWERPNAPLKPGIPPPQRPPAQNRLF